MSKDKKVSDYSKKGVIVNQVGMRTEFAEGEGNARGMLGNIRRRNQALDEAAGMSTPKANGSTGANDSYMDQRKRGQ